MAKKTKADAEAPQAAGKPTPQEKAQRKADKASRQAAKALTNNSAEKKVSQKQTLKAAAKNLQKELDNRLNETVARIRKETKATLKEVVKEASRRLDVDTEHLFKQALHTLVRHYDDIAPGRSSDLNFPAPTPTTADEAEIVDAQQAEPAASARATRPNRSKSGNSEVTKASAPSKQPAAKATPKPTKAALTASSSRGSGRPQRGTNPADMTTESVATDANTPVATPNDGAAVDIV